MTDLHHGTPQLDEHHPVWQRVCQLDDLEPGWGEAALVAGDQLAIFRLASGEIYAVQHSDPVTGARVIARGITGTRTVDGASRPTVASPLHKQVYDLATGDCLTETGPRLRTFPTRVIDGWLDVAA